MRIQILEPRVLALLEVLQVDKKSGRYVGQNLGQQAAPSLGRNCSIPFSRQPAGRTMQRSYSRNCSEQLLTACTSS